MSNEENSTTIIKQKRQKCPSREQVGLKCEVTFSRKIINKNLIVVRLLVDDLIILHLQFNVIEYGPNTHVRHKEYD